MKEAIKNFIIDKAKHIFEKKGFKNTTIEDIANASSISIPTVYNYFNGKRELFIDVIKSIDSQLSDEVTPIFESKLNIFNKIDKLLEVLISFVRKNKEIVRISFFDSEAFTSMTMSDGGDLLKNKRKRLLKLVELIENEKNTSEIEYDISSESIALFIMGIMHELFFEIIFKKEEINPDKLKDDFMIVLKNGILKKYKEEGN